MSHLALASLDLETIQFHNNYKVMSVRLKFGEQMLPIQFGFDALEEILGENPEEYGKNGLKDIRRAIYIGLKHGHKAENEKFSIKEDQIGTLVDSSPESASEVLSMFREEARRYVDIFTPAKKK